MTAQFSNRPWFKWSLISLFLIWIFGMVGVFYVVQKPFSLVGLQNLTQLQGLPLQFSGVAVGRTLLDLLTALGLWWFNLGLGLWLYQQLMKRFPQTETAEATDHSGLRWVIIGSGLGFGLVGLIIFLLGLLGLIQPPILLALTIGGSVITAPRVLAALKQVRLPAMPPLLKLYLLLTLGLALTIALLPPSDWDGLFYHLTGPKLYLSAGRILPGIDIPHFSFPALFEMQFMLAMALRGATAAKLLHFGFSLLLAGLVYSLAQKQLRAKNSWPAIAILFSMPMVLTLASWAYNDLALAFFQVAALALALNYQASLATDRPDYGHLILSGIFCGLAMSLKYTSFIAPLTLVGLLLWWHWTRRESPRKVVIAVGLFALTAGLVAAPWYLKNWAFTGNPVYPFVFEGLYWDDFRSVAYSGAGSGIGFDLSAILTLPYFLTLGLHDANYVDGRTGPLFLAFLPLILLYGIFQYRRSQRPPALNGLLIFVLAQYLFWLLGVIWSDGLWQSRLLLPALVGLCPVLAWLLDDLRHLNHPQFSLQRFLYLLLPVVLVLGLIDQLLSDQFRANWFSYRPLSYLIGTETEAAYLGRRLGVHYQAMAEIETQFPPQAVVAFLWEPRSYYCQLDCRPDSILDEFGHLQYLHGSDPAAIVQAWREKGISHVLVHRLGYDFLLHDGDTTPEIRPNVELLKALESEYLELIFDLDGAYQGYRIK